MNTTKSFTFDVESISGAPCPGARPRTSLSRVAKAMLRAASGLTTIKKKRDLSWIHANKWSSSEAKAFDKAIADTEKIVPGDW
jgi:hypothetical protein